MERPSTSVPMEKYYTESLNWDFILDKIQNEQCLLVLGPEAFTGEDGVSYHDKLIRQLDPANNKHVRRFSAIRWSARRWKPLPCCAHRRI